MLCKIHMQDFKSHLQQDFLAYYTRPVSVHLAVTCWLLIQQFFNLFAQFKTTTKSHKNDVFLYLFSICPPPPPQKKHPVFYASKLYGLTGMV